MTKAAPDITLEAPQWLEIASAHQRILPRIHRTPVLTSTSLDRLFSAQLFFKCENFQKTGSFKIRGAANAILSLSEEQGARGIVTHSSGNHGAAVACAASWRGLQSWVVMPRNAPRIKCQAVESYGGEITFCEPTITSRTETLHRVQSETGAHLVHPFDDDRVIAGQATAAKELLEQVPDLDAMLVPVSGGGLLSGTCLTAQQLSRGLQVWGCEPQKADDAFRSLQSGVLQRHDSSDTIADGLRAALSERTFAILRHHLKGVLLVTEAEIIAAMRLLWERMKIIVEPSAAVALAPLLNAGGLQALKLPPHPNDRPPKIGFILSGGNVDLSSLPF